MKRRNFLQLISTGGAVLSSGAILSPTSARAQQERAALRAGKNELAADVVIAGGGMGGCAAALAALRNGLRVIMTEETDWVGGQLTQQGVPMDEHRWIEQFGATRTYREFRTAIREYYRRNYPLTEAARARWNLNPGDGSVSRVAHEPRVSLALFHDLLNPYLASKKLILLLEHKAVSADVNGDKVTALKIRSLRTGNETVLRAPYFVDATELGDLLPMTGTEFVMGAESQKETGELHAPEKGDPLNQQAFTVCFAIDYVAGTNNVGDKPRNYEFWRDYVPQLTPPWSGNLLSFTYSSPVTLKPRTLPFIDNKTSLGTSSWFRYRRIVNKENFTPGFYPGDISIINWPQNDYLPGPLVGVSEEEAAKHVEGGKELSHALLYWIQTEAPRDGGEGQGYPEVSLRGDIMGTEDGMAKYPYIREARRIKAETIVMEQQIGRDARAKFTGQPLNEVAAEKFKDSVGLGSYNIDLHPSTGGDNYIDVPSLPFQIPLGTLLPVRVTNLLPACKNIGTTHITNGCYRLHPVEWNIGESVGLLVAYALEKKEEPRAIRAKANLLSDFQNRIRAQGVETDWPKGQF
ncbi:MAG: FAD-dependent oxidoreductase [Verrucomicrobia bacterium]|nr:FAD-dependent oxidoreductase [Verrucomicrobiota bacterium]